MARPTSSSLKTAALAAAALVAVPVVAASVAACDDPVPATPRGIVESSITGTGSAGACNQSGQWIAIGGFGNPVVGADGGVQNPAVPVDDGKSFGDGQVDISCSVIPSGDGFTVNAQAAISGTRGGALTIAGTFKAEGDQQPVRVVFTSSERGRFVQNDCVARYDGRNMGIAAGRVWANVVCPAAKNDEQQQVCQTTAQFRFENCTQKAAED